jgi:hypothetical protein
MTISFRRTVVALGCVLAASAIAPQAVQAAPFATAGAGDMVGESIVVEAQARRRPVVRNRARNNAAVAAAVGIGVLGLAAAAAASQPRGGSYYGDSYGYPVDAWGRPVYGSSYGYGRPVQYYDDRGYYGRPVYREPRLSRWEKEQIKAQERARREAVRQSARRQQAEREWAWRQQNGWRQQNDWRYRDDGRVRGDWRYGFPQNGPAGLDPR